MLNCMNFSYRMAGQGGLYDGVIMKRKLTLNSWPDFRGTREEDVNSYWLAKCCYSGISRLSTGSLNLIRSQ